jgi:hypothetical protein
VYGDLALAALAVLNPAQHESCDGDEERTHCDPAGKPGR